MKKAPAAKGRVQGKPKAKRSAKAKARSKTQAKPKTKAKVKAKVNVKARARAKTAAAPAKRKANAKASRTPKRAPKTIARVAKKKAPPRGRTRANRDAPPESTRTPKATSNGATAHPLDVAATAYDTDVLTVMVREAESDDPREAEEKIRKHLAERKLGEFDSGRINQLRALKDAVVDEIQRAKDSSYFVGSHGLYANPEDFDHKRLARDFSERFPSVSHEAIVGFIPFAIYCYYLR